MASLKGVAGIAAAAAAAGLTGATIAAIATGAAARDVVVDDSSPAAAPAPAATSLLDSWPLGSWVAEEDSLAAPEPGATLEAGAAVRAPADSGLIVSLALKGVTGVLNLEKTRVEEGERERGVCTMKKSWREEGRKLEKKSGEEKNRRGMRVTGVHVRERGRDYEENGGK